MLEIQPFRPNLLALDLRLKFYVVWLLDILNLPEVLELLQVLLGVLEVLEMLEVLDFNGPHLVLVKRQQR